MLTADLVRVQKRGGALHLLPFDAKRRATAEQLAGQYLAVYAAEVGSSREELEEALQEVEVHPRDLLLSRGLRKLIEDRAVFDAELEVDASEVRRVVFERAAALRRSLEDGERLDRERALAEAGAALALAPDVVERVLFSDLRGAQILRSLEAIGPAGLVDAYDRGRAQAILLRAVRVVAQVECATPAAYRALFHRMKFLRLLHTIERAQPGVRLTIDGPMSMFESVTKYGLELAMLLPVLEGCERYRLAAEVKWPKEAGTLVFETAGGLQSDRPRARGGRSTSPGLEPEPTLELRLPDEVERLREKLASIAKGWSVAVAAEILELPGIGLCVPDLVLTRLPDSGLTGAPRVFVEVMGHWSRAAVWRRVELVERGLTEPIVFAVSTRLRVSEEALDAEAPGALYVYKGTMSAKSLLERVEAVAARGAPRPG